MDSRSFREICRTTAGRDTIEIIAGKLDDMASIPAGSQPASVEPGYHEPESLSDETIRGFVDRAYKPSQGGAVRMAKELLHHRAKLKPGMSDDQVEIARLRSLSFQNSRRAEKAEAALAAVTRRHDGDSYERLAKAAIALYRAGHWTAEIAMGDQARLWTELRDALGLPAGGSNKPAVTITNTPHPWRD